jgi:lipoate synthase
VMIKYSEPCTVSSLHICHHTDLIASWSELRNVGVDVVTFGQYMRPTKRHMKVARYVEPSEFLEWKRVAEGLGFLYVASGPLVRSSYKVSSQISPVSTFINSPRGR